MEASMEASTTSAEASVEVVEASMEALEASTTSTEASMEASTDFHKKNNSGQDRKCDSAIQWLIGFFTVRARVELYSHRKQ